MTTPENKRSDIANGSVQIPKWLIGLLCAILLGAITTGAGSVLRVAELSVELRALEEQASRDIENVRLLNRQRYDDIVRRLERIEQRLDR